MHLKISSLAASATAKCSYNIGTNETEKLVLNSDYEKQCTSNVSNTECTHYSSEYSTTKSVTQQKKQNKNRDTVILVNISDPALNHTEHLIISNKVIII
jgi:hypothetical protein